MKTCGCLDDARECATARSFIGTLCPCKCHAESPAIAPDALTDADRAAIAEIHNMPEQGVLQDLLYRVFMAGKATRAETGDDARDSERLSWIDRDDIEMSFGSDVSGGPFVLIRDGRGKWLAGAGNIRDAIDQAQEAASNSAARKPNVAQDADGELMMTQYRAANMTAKTEEK